MLLIWLIWSKHNDSKRLKMTETLAYGYPYMGTQRELSNEYHHDRIKMVFKNLCVPVLWMKVSLISEGLKKYSTVSR